MTDEPYNPLANDNLARGLASVFSERDLHPLPPEQPVVGAGVYLLYYTGGFPLYAPISSTDCRDPIYVGKAVPRPKVDDDGVLAQPEASTALRGRLNKHRQSITQAENIELADFRCRYLVLEDVWVPLAEGLLIRHYRALWNYRLPGFGINAPGGGRKRQERSRWDTVHPGRPYAMELPLNAKSLEDIEDEVHRFLTGEVDAGLPLEQEADAASDALGE